MTLASTVDALPLADATRDRVRTLTGGGPFAVLAPHPDDEVLGAGLLLAAAARMNQFALVVVATDGASASADSRQAASRLANLRRAECRAGLSVLGTRPPICLAMPDGRLAEMPGIHERLALLLRSAGVRTLVTTDPDDPHPDHRASFRLAVQMLAAGIIDRIVTMPVTVRLRDDAWTPGPRHQPLTAPELAEVKRAAIATHSSQWDDSGNSAHLPRAAVAAMVDSEWFRVLDRQDSSTSSQPTPLGDASRTALCAIVGPAAGTVLLLGNPDMAEALTHDQAQVTRVDPARLASNGGLVLPDGGFDVVVIAGLDGVPSVAALAGAAPVLRQRLLRRSRLIIANSLKPVDAAFAGNMGIEAMIAVLPGLQIVDDHCSDATRITVLKVPDL